MEDKYTVSCILCNATNNLVMVAHRNKDGKLVGWIFACSECKEKVYDKKIDITYTGVI